MVRSIFLSLVLIAHVLSETEARAEAKALAIDVAGAPKEAAAVGQKVKLQLFLTNVSAEDIEVGLKPGFTTELWCQLDADNLLIEEEAHHEIRWTPSSVKRPRKEYVASDFQLLKPAEVIKAEKEITVPSNFRNKMVIEVQYISKFDGEAVGKKAWVGELKKSVEVPIQLVAPIKPTEPPTEAF